jgi:predicted sugar kinase
MLTDWLMKTVRSAGIGVDVAATVAGGSSVDGGVLAGEKLRVAPKVPLPEKLRVAPKASLPEKLRVAPKVPLLEKLPVRLKLEVIRSTGLAEKVSVGLGARSSVLASTTLSIINNVRLVEKRLDCLIQLTANASELASCAVLM